MYVRKRPVDHQPPTLEYLREEYARLTKNYTRRHGRKAKVFATPEEEYKQLYNNVSSIKSRNARKEMEARADKSYVEKYGFGADDADIYGITPKDRRRYEAKFKNCPHGSRVTLEYLRRMTGLTLKQVYILQEQTGLIPYPKVSKIEADKDQKYRDDNGIYI